MLTGLIPIDGGSATIEGHDVGTQIGDIRKNLGVCPQHDILYPMLTIEEHLYLFAAFKGVPPSLQREEVESMIQIVGLTEKRHVQSKYHSILFILSTKVNEYYLECL
jgi:ABC-type multidrug transport system ATPase subunit